MVEHKILYTSDTHGNMQQLKRFVAYAKEISPDTIILAGEIAPKGSGGYISDSYIETQRSFLETELPTMLRSLKDEKPNCNIYVSMGNDDCTCNLDILTKNDPKIFQVLQGRKRLTNNLEIVGYPYVPITPFEVKDLEKFDLSEPKENQRQEYNKRKRTNYNFRGIRSSQDGWSEFEFRTEMETYDSIQRDLQSDIYTNNSDRTIYVFHAPPTNTKLDQLEDGQHVGSFAVRNFIETYQPRLTLHGHIHETTDVSGDFRDTIGETLCLSAGNHNEGNKMHVLVFDAYHPDKVERIKLSYGLLSKLFW